MGNLTYLILTIVVCFGLGFLVPGPVALFAWFLIYPPSDIAYAWGSWTAWRNGMLIGWALAAVLVVGTLLMTNGSPFRT